MFKFIKSISNGTIYKVLYRNWRNEVAIRNIMIKSVFVTTRGCCSDENLIYHVYDIDKKDMQHFEAKNIINIISTKNQNIWEQLK